jgi:hypothetical protein
MLNDELNFKIQISKSKINPKFKIQNKKNNGRVNEYKRE